MNKLGITNILILTAIIADFANVADEIGHTSGISKWGHAIELLPDTVKLTSINFPDLKAEIKDLDASERAQVEQVFKDKFDIKDDQLEAVIEDGISLLEDVANTMTHGKKFIDSVKALKKVA